MVVGNQNQWLNLLPFVVLTHTFVHVRVSFFGSSRRCTDWLYLAYEYSSFTTRRWLSLSIKLPLDLVLFLRPKKDLPPVRFVYVESFRPAAPPAQKSAVERNKHATAVHMNANALTPTLAAWLLALKLFLPITYAAL